MEEVQQRSPYLRLLISLIVLGAIYPVLDPMFANAIVFGRMGLAIWTLSFWAVLYMALHSMKCSKRILMVARLLMVLVVVISLAGVATLEKWVQMGFAVVSMAFLALTTFEILKDVLSGTTVDLNRIWGAVCVYIMIGLFWAFAFVIIQLQVPNAILGMTGLGMTRPDHSSVVLADMLHFSFVTLTTLGYGDLFPRIHVARFLASAEAISGQLYLTILVARLVGLHIVSARDVDRTD